MAEIREVAPESWDETLGRMGLSDVYLQRAYVDTSRFLDAGCPTLLLFEGQGGSVVQPLILRDIPGAPGMRDVSTAYGYGGPMASVGEPPLEAFYEAYALWCGRMDVVTTFVRFHPLCGNHRLADPRMTLVPLGGTIAWRLTDRDLLGGMHSHHNRMVRKARRAGVEVAIEEGAGELDAFRMLYEATMRRRKASDFYFFVDAYWAALARELGPSLVSVEARLHGEIIAGALCLGSPPWLHYHLGASSDLGRSVGANHLLMLETAMWARSRGHRIFHLGGGVGGARDGLFEFKQRFDVGGVVPAFIGKQIHQLTAYQQLSNASTTEGYFPAYRSSEQTVH